MIRDGREEGYYWVRWWGCETWSIAKWEQKPGDIAVWYLCGDDKPHNDAEFCEAVAITRVGAKNVSSSA